MVSQGNTQPSPLHLLVGSKRLWSSRGVLQDDPLDRNLFDLALDRAMADGTLAGSTATVAADLQRLPDHPKTKRLYISVAAITGGGGKDVHPEGRDTNCVNNAASLTNANTFTNGKENSDPHSDASFSLAHPTPLASLFLLGAPLPRPRQSRSLSQHRRDYQETH